MKRVGVVGLCWGVWEGRGDGEVVVLGALVVGVEVRGLLALFLFLCGNVARGASAILIVSLEEGMRVVRVVIW